MEQIQIVSRNAIPPIHSVEQDGERHDLGELRDFRWNDQLKEFLPDDSRFSVSWVRLQHLEVLKPHVHPIQSMMVFYAGSGQMLGDLTREVAKDDVVVVPPGCQHGFVGGPDGLSALSIQLGHGFYTKPEKPRVTFSEGGTTLPTLLAHAERRLEQFELGPIFDLMAGAALDDASSRRTFKSALQLWTEGIWTTLCSRLASTADPLRRGLYFDDVLQRMKQSQVTDLFRGPAGEPPLRDPLLEASINWFSYQMYVLDDSEKCAVVHLVIDPATRALVQEASSLLAGNRVDQPLLGGSDERLVQALLRGQAPKTYGRMRDVIDEAWNMIEALTDRVAVLARGH